MSERSAPEGAPCVVYDQADLFDLERRGFKVGFTMLEVDGLPADWVAACNRMDEIWTPSRWGVEVFRDAGVTRPLRAMPLGFDPARFRPGLPAHRIARAGIARTYQIPRPFAHLSVRDNVALSAMFGGAALDRTRSADAAARWLRFTGLDARSGALPGDLNLHQTKFLELARALSAQPRLLLLDEVLSGLTPAEIDEAVDLILRIRGQGTTIVLVEHVMRIVTALSDRIVVLDQGRVLAEVSAADVMARHDVAAAYLGVAHA